MEGLMTDLKYYIYRFFDELIPIYPLYLLMFEKGGLSVSQISLLLAIWSVPSVILEIPTGVLADRWSRRNMLLLGQVLKAGCYLIWIFADCFGIYALGFVLWGIGGTFKSGSEEALLYDSMKLTNREERFEQILGRGRFLSGISTVLASIFGGLIGMRFGLPLVLIISVISALSGAITVFSMKEVNLYKDRIATEKREREERTLQGALTFIVKRKEILLYSLLSLLVITTAGILDEYDQLIAEGFGLSIALIGGWTAVRFILIAFGGILASSMRRGIERIFRQRDRMFQVAILCCMAAGALLAAGLIRSILVMALYGLYYLIMAAGDVLHEDYIQKRIEAEGRSTVHSLISLGQNLYGILCYGLFGLLVSGSNLFNGLVWTGVYIVIWTLFLCTLYRKWRERD
jgi:MFS family permease